MAIGAPYVEHARAQIHTTPTHTNKKGGINKVYISKIVDGGHSQINNVPRSPMSCTPGQSLADFVLKILLIQICSAS